MDANEIDREPMFLVGAERSGTTLLRLMLDHHPEIAFFSEFEFAVERMDESGRPPDLAAYHAWLRSDRLFLDSGFRIDPALPYPDLVRSFLEQKRRCDGKARCGATVHKAFDRLPHVWPSARYIHLLRDPRDVARSAIPMGWAGNLWCGAERWVEAEETWQRLEDALPRDRWLEVRYESLVREPQAELERICAFIGVAYHPHMLSYPETTTYPAPDPAVAERWRASLSTDELSLVEARVGPLLEARGYAPSGAPVVAPTASDRRRLERQDRIARVRFRIDRFGPWLFVLEFVTRRLGLARLHGQVLRRMHVITRQHLR